MGDASQVTDAILTIPNLVTFARLALLPLFLWLALGPKQTGAAFAVGFIAGSTDFIDGKLARKLGQVSRLGIALDPLSDRLALGAAAAVLIVRHLAPLWAVLLVVARDALLLGAIPLVAARGVPRPPVTRTGKAATMGLMWAFGLFLAAAIPIPPLGWVRVLAWLFYYPGIVLSWASAMGYAGQVLNGFRTPAPGATG